MSVYVQGLEEVLQRFDELADAVPAAIRTGAMAGAEIVAARAAELAPKKKGYMARHLVALPTEDGAEVVGTAVYPEIQETNETFNHPNGGQAHFLRDAAEQSKGDVMAEIVKAINANFQDGR